MVYVAVDKARLQRLELVADTARAFMDCDPHGSDAALDEVGHLAEDLRRALRSLDEIQRGSL